MKRWIPACLFAVSAALFTTAQASLILSNAPNGVRMTAAVDGFYKGATTTDHVYGPTGMVASGHADPTSPYPPISGPALIDPGPPVAPASGTGTIDAYVKSAFDFGAPVGTAARDSFTLYSNLKASALSAHNSAGEQAAAVVRSLNRIEFFLDSRFGGVAPDTPLGTAVFTGIRSTSTYERARLDVYQDGGHIPIASLLPGGAGLTVSLLSGHAYAFELLHGFNVPYGVDPTGTLSVTGTLLPSTVPEPSVVWLLGGLLLLSATVVRRRQVEGEVR